MLDDLLSPDGQHLQAELAAETITDDLRIITKYRARYSRELVAAALEQVKLRVRARTKFDRADEMYFTRAGLEQASTERMARHHATRFSGFERVADLCSGIGGDLIGLAARGDVLAVDLDPLHSRIGMLNARAYDVEAHVTPVVEDVRTVSLAGVDAAFVDPARRSGEGRMRKGESEPPLDWCFAVANQLPLGVKAAPGLPLDVAPSDWEIEFVSEGRELKEAVLWSPALATVPRRATVLGETTHTLIADDQPSIAVRPPGSFLLDPDPSVTRAGLVETLGSQLQAWKIDEQVAFLSSDQPMSTPFGRLLRVEASLPWSLGRLREALRELDVGTVDIRKRGSAVDVDDLQRRLKLKGSRAATVVLTRVGDRPWAMVCSGPDLT
jgi:hypothetical protein